MRRVEQIIMLNLWGGRSLQADITRVGGGSWCPLGEDSFLPVTIPYNPGGFSTMIPRLKGGYTMTNRTIKGELMAKSLDTN